LTTFFGRSCGYGVGIPKPWFTRSVIYELDVQTFFDDNGRWDRRLRRPDSKAHHASPAVTPAYGAEIYEIG
jgi:hypothetical protein